MIAHLRYDIVACVRQLIARIDDELHARLKERAGAEHRSLNSLVRELLERGVAQDDARAQLRSAR